MDPEAATIAVLRLDDGELKVVSVYAESDILTSTVLDGFSVALADIFQG